MILLTVEKIKMLHVFPDDKFFNLVYFEWS
jgi:hypothetical protein